MPAPIELFRAVGGANMSRYRVGGLTVLTIAEGHRMTCGRVLMVAGLVVVEGILTVRKESK